MRDLAPITLTPAFYKQTLAVAHHYGFKSFDDLCASTPTTTRLPAVPRDARRYDALDGEFVRTIKRCLENNIPEHHPSSLFYHNEWDSSSRNRMRFGLEVVGIRESVAEATVLKTAASILEEAGIHNILVHINSVGDRDSAARHHRELTAFFRKHINDLSPQGQVAFKRSPFDALQFVHNKQQDLAQRAPKSMEFLSRDSRRHLREVLEYLEGAEVPYELDDSLIGNNDCYTQTVFEIRLHNDELEENEPQILARGGRYDELSRKLFKLTAPAVGLMFSLLKKGREKLIQPRLNKKPRICFVRLGPDAERKSLVIVDMLRKAKVPLARTVGPVGLSDQLAYARTLRVPHTIILGQKEAMEDTVIVRDMETRAQEVVDIQALPDYLKSI